MKKLLIAGFGDIARRAAPQLQARYSVQALSRRHGFDLDRPETLAGLAAADAMLHCAPPPAAGAADTRTRNLLAALAKGGILPARVVYVSTSGVYGDCGGARVDESRAVQPQTDRARRDAQGRIAPELLSFMSESRRLANRRMKDGLGVRLRYRTVSEGVPRPGEAA